MDNDKAAPISSLFTKYDNLKFWASDTLFPPDLSVIKEQRCPLCLNKLYEMRGKPFFFCKSVKHRRRFIVSKDKMK